MPASHLVTDDQQEFILRQVKAGRYKNEADVISDALDLLREQEVTMENFTSMIEQGCRDLEEGKFRDAEEVFDELEARCRPPGLTA